MSSQQISHVDTASLVAAQLTAAALGLATNIVAARALTPVEFGLATLIIAYPTLLWSLVNVKSASVTTRYISAFLEAGRSAEIAGFSKLGVLIDILASLAAVVLVAIPLPLFAPWATVGASATDLTLLYSLSLPIFALSNTGSSVLSSYGRFRVLAGFQVLERLTSFVMTVLLLRQTGNVAAVIVGRAAGNVAIGVAMIASMTQLLQQGGAGRWWNAPLANLRPFMSQLSGLFGWSYVSATVAGIVGQVPLLLLGSMRGPEEAGYYRLATNLVGIGRYVEGALGRIAYPQLSRLLAAKDASSVRHVLKGWTVRFGIPAAACLLLAAPLLPYLVPAVFGDEYRSIIPGTRLMLVGSALSAVFFWTVSFYFALGRIDTWTKVQSVFGAATIGGGWIVIRSWGFWGMAALTAAIESARTLVLLDLARNALRRPGEPSDRP